MYEGVNKVDDDDDEIIKTTFEQWIKYTFEERPNDPTYDPNIEVALYDPNAEMEWYD